MEQGVVGAAGVDPEFVSLDIDPREEDHHEHQPRAACHDPLDQRGLALELGGLPVGCVDGLHPCQDLF
jgi:hypothetical protein